MTLFERFLTGNPYSRDGKRLREVLAVVIHWTGKPGQDADDVRGFFESRKSGGLGYGSAHYIVGLGGAIIRCIPETERAFHVGSDRPDPASGRIYTDEARARFGKYAKADTNSPNNCTIGIELCAIDSSGRFSEKTELAAVELCADILLRHGLGVDAITTHHNIVGWKDCPKLWTGCPELLAAFREEVDTIIDAWRV